MSGSTDTPATYAHIGPGDPAPWFTQESASNPRYHFDTVAGRYVVLCFFGSAAAPEGAAAMKAVRENGQLFDDVRASFFGVSVDRGDRDEERVAEVLPGRRFFWDFDHSVSRLYGATPREAAAGASVPMRLFWLILDPTLRVIARIPFARDGSDRAQVFEELRRLPPPERFAGFEIPAPILVLPGVFEPDFCARLIEAYERHGGVESGFMRDVGGKTTQVTDHGHKRRRDYVIDDKGMTDAVQARILRRVVPEIEKIFAFKATRMERYIVGCYAAEDGGHFRPHRDNTTRGTAHRRFAVSINLNADFAGGEVGFPEYGTRRYKAPPGGAVIFPCALLHTVTPVTQGKRYAFLPFLYDEAAAKLREENARFLAQGGAYKA